MTLIATIYLHQRYHQINDGSSNVFLQSIGKIGNTIRTGYTASTGKIADGWKSITNSISEGFSSLTESTGNVWKNISKGAKNLFKKLKLPENRRKSRKFIENPSFFSRFLQFQELKSTKTLIITVYFAIRRCQKYKKLYN